MESGLNLEIKLKYNTFTAAYKRIADFVLSNPEYVVNQSISEVAAACGVGDATITRFCKNLGYKSYHDFKLSIVKNLPKEPGNTIEDVYSGDITLDDTVSAVAKNILNKDIEALNETEALIREEAVQQAVEYMSKAGRILFFGVGSSLTAALEGCNKFMRITPKAGIYIETHMQYAAASLMNESDVAVIISYSGSTKEIVEIAQTAKKRGARIICITRYLTSPLTHYSDVSLLCSSNERNVHGFSLSMELTQIFLLDVLYTEFFRQNYEKSLQNKNETTAILSDKLF